MFEKYNEQARRIIILAQEEARTLNHHYVGTEHLLLAMTRKHSNPSLATRILTALNVDHDDILALVTPGQGEPGNWHLPFTPGAKNALDLAWHEALIIGRDGYISAEHLLLGLAVQDEGIAARILGPLDTIGIRQVIIENPPVSVPLDLTGS